nr:flavodoxin domain-containing protein [uncultured Celeribacter sp.]
MDIAILFGTETGNAEMLAEDIQTALEDAGHDVTLANLCDVSPSELDIAKLHLVVCSTYGDGELPASAQPFGEAMKDAPDLSGLKFGIFGLGDSEYDTYNLGSKLIEDMLVDAGAVCLGERLTHDASGSDMAEDVALPWAESIVEAAQS